MFIKRFNRQFMAFMSQDNPAGGGAGKAEDNPTDEPKEFEKKEANPKQPDTKATHQDDPAKEVTAQLKELQDQLKAQQKELEKYKAKEQDELDKQKSTDQKLAEREAELAKAKREVLVTKLALQKGLDADLIDRVKGDDEDTIATDINMLVTKFGEKKVTGEGAVGKKTQPPKGNDKEPEQMTNMEQKTANFMGWRQSQMSK
jgi:hypothetical protein